MQLLTRRKSRKRKILLIDFLIIHVFLGSKNDNMIPFLSRKCRAFALDNNEKTGEPTTELLLNPELKPGMEACNGAKVDTLKNGTLVDCEDEDETQKSPDLSQIIRSLDTPPPS